MKNKPDLHVTILPSFCSFLLDTGDAAKMCGIIAIVNGSNLPPLPQLPFWKGAASLASDSNEPIVTSPPHLEQYLSPLLRRGPDRTDIQTTAVAPSVTIETASTILSLRGASPNNGDGLLPDHKPCSRSVLIFNGEIYDGFEDGVSPTVCDTQQLHTLLDRTVDNAGDLLSVLDTLRGPWALAFWHPALKRLYFGRDCIGRRSLLISAVDDSHIVITSVPCAERRHGFMEIPPVGLLFLDFADAVNPVFGIHARPMHPVVPSRLNTRDSTAVVSGSTSDMYVSFLPAAWLRTQSENSRGEADVHSLLTSQSAEKFISLLSEGVRRRLVTNRVAVKGEPRFALLFSGGIDSMVIAQLLDVLMPLDEELHLINVAFGDDDDALNACPDRRTAIDGLIELRQLSTSGREIDLICVDVSTTEARSTLCNPVRALVYPCDQPMDATIGTAIWLAARGTGYFYKVAQGEECTKLDISRGEVTISARILFSGLGADELMGGYKGRHRTIYRIEGEAGVSREMDADLSRLWFRNLGRDDRLVADHGKEVRHPFLDEDVISFVTSLPLTQHVCDLSKADGVGDKQLLRRGAALLGLSESTTTRAKRAIQFGSRSKQVIERKSAYK